MTEHVLMVSMPVTELKQMINDAVDTALDRKFEPLRRQFEDRLIDRVDAAKALGVTLATLHNWNKNGTLLHVKIGGSVKYRESDITTFLSNKNNKY